MNEGGKVDSYCPLVLFYLLVALHIQRHQRSLNRAIRMRGCWRRTLIVGLGSASEDENDVWNG